MKLLKLLIALGIIVAVFPPTAEALPVVSNAQDNALSTLAIFAFAAVVYVWAWPFRYLSKTNDNPRARVDQATAWMPFEAFTPYMRIVHAFFYATWFVGIWFLWLTDSQVTWAFFLLMASFGLSLFVDKFVWYRLVTTGNHNFGIASYFLLSWLPDIVSVVLWAIFNFLLGCGGCGDTPIVPVGFGITGVVLVGIWVLYRLYIFCSMAYYFYWGDGRDNPINAAGRMKVNHPAHKTN